MSTLGGWGTETLAFGTLPDPIRYVSSSGFSSVPLRKFYYYLFNFNFILLFWPQYVACGILVPQSGIKPGYPGSEAQSLNHWTTREVPHLFSLSNPLINW